mgnify:CR=1 FL=1
MNSVLPIQQGSITGITGLEKRPVYFLRLNGAAQPNLVVKGDARNGSHPGITDAEALVSIKWSSKLMKNVNNTLVNTKILTAPEFAVFQQAAQATFGNGSRQRGFLTQPFKWVKMPMVPGLSDAEFYNDGNDVETRRLKEVVPKLLDDAVWRDLGRVLAVDIFAGNSDRFDVATGDWVNKGNLMFLDGGATAVIGLDTFDPNSQDQGNLANRGGFEAMRTLTDAARRDTFALACTRSVGSELQRAATAKLLGRFTLRVPGLNDAVIAFDVENLGTLYERYAPLLAQGIAAGAAALRAYLQGKQQQYAPQPSWQNANASQAQRRIIMGGNRTVQPKQLPAGVRQRMAYLGW